MKGSDSVTTQLKNFGLMAEYYVSSIRPLV